MWPQCTLAFCVQESWDGQGSFPTGFSLLGWFTRSAETANKTKHWHRRSEAVSGCRACLGFVECSTPAYTDFLLHMTHCSSLLEGVEMPALLEPGESALRTVIHGFKRGPPAYGPWVGSPADRAWREEGMKVGEKVGRGKRVCTTLHNGLCIHI